MTKNTTAVAPPRRSALAPGAAARTLVPEAPQSSGGIQTLQQSMGNQAIQRQVKAGTLNAEMVLAARFGLGNQVMQRLIQRKIDLKGDYLDGLSSRGAKFNNSTWVQIIDKYRAYHTTKKEQTELTLIKDMLTLIGNWIDSVEYQVVTQKLSTVDEDKRKRLRTLRRALQDEKPKLEARINKRTIFEELGVPISYLDELKAADFDLLWSAHINLQEGDVGKADAALTKLKASIGDVVDMLKSALLRRHIGNVNPGLEKLMKEKKYQVTDPKTEARAEARLTKDIDSAGGGIAGNAKRIHTEKGRADLKGMTLLEVRSLVGYSSGYYNEFNKPLRNEVGSDKFDKEKLALTQLTVSALNKLKKYKGLCFRHDNNFAGFKELNRVGATVSDMAFLSTTYDQEAIKELILPTTHEVLQILESKRGRIIEEASLIKAEKEVLFKPGTSFTVTARFDRNPDDSWTPKLSDAAKKYLDADHFKNKVKIIVFKTEA